MFGWTGLGGGRPRHDDPKSVTAPVVTASGVTAPPANDPLVPADRLTIGRGLTFNGAIATCDHLVVGGSVTADLAECRILDIAPDGSFHGSATIAEADIAGRFEGELHVLGCLRIRAAGYVRGRITYGSLAIEPGGQLIGIVTNAAQAARAQPRPVIVPLRSATVRSHDGTA